MNEQEFERLTESLYYRNYVAAAYTLRMREEPVDTMDTILRLLQFKVTGTRDDLATARIRARCILDILSGSADKRG